MGERMASENSLWDSRVRCELYCKFELMLEVRVQISVR
jgi:hypothetical protein